MELKGTANKDQLALNHTRISNRKAHYRGPELKSGWDAGQKIFHLHPYPGDISKIINRSFSTLTSLQFDYHKPRWRKVSEQSEEQMFRSLCLLTIESPLYWPATCLQVHDKVHRLKRKSTMQHEHYHRGNNKTRSFVAAAPIPCYPFPSLPPLCSKEHHRSTMSESTASPSLMAQGPAATYSQHVSPASSSLLPHLHRASEKSPERGHCGGSAVLK